MGTVVVTVAATGVVECLVHARGSYPRRNGGPVPYGDVPDGTKIESTREGTESTESRSFERTFQISASLSLNQLF